MQATFPSDLDNCERHIMPIHWDGTAPSYVCKEAFKIVTVQTNHRSLAAIPCFERHLSPIGSMFWSLAYRSTPPTEYQPVCVEFPDGLEAPLDLELLPLSEGKAKVQLAETPQPWPDTIDGWVRDVDGRLVCVPLAPRLAVEPNTGQGRRVVRSYALHGAKAVLELDVYGHSPSRNAMEVPPVKLAWSAFVKCTNLPLNMPDPRTEIDP